MTVFSYCSGGLYAPVLSGQHVDELRGPPLNASI